MGGVVVRGCARGTPVLYFVVASWCALSNVSRAQASFRTGNLNTVLE